MAQVWARDAEARTILGHVRRVFDVSRLGGRACTCRCGIRVPCAEDLQTHASVTLHDAYGGVCMRVLDAQARLFQLYHTLVYRTCIMRSMTPKL